ncbi:MAG TPA: HD domain-containing protein [Bacteroidales bacterium]|nr:HD domain-containing protein [Bacteroidales bacterium]
MKENTHHILVEESRKYVLDLFDKYLSEKLIYHSNQHTLNVLDHAETIAANTDISEHETELIKIAALFHDAGYIKSYENHEMHSAIMARDFLVNRDVDKNDVDVICDAILATAIPQKPKGIIAEILCDADLMHLAAADYFEQVESIRLEWAKIGKANLNDFEFLKTSLAFFDSHHYHTNYGIKVLAPLKEVNRQRIQDRLAKSRNYG